MSNLTPHQIDIASMSAYATSGGTVIAALTLHDISELALIVSLSIGSLVAIGTFFLNWYFKHKNYKLNVRGKARRVKK